MRLRTLFVICATLIAIGCTADQVSNAQQRLQKLENATTQPAAVATSISQTTGSQLAASIAAALVTISLIERTLRIYVIPAFKKDATNPNASSGGLPLASTSAATEMPMGAPTTLQTNIFPNVNTPSKSIT